MLAQGKDPAAAEDFAAARGLVDELLAALDAKEMHITTGMGGEAIHVLSVYGKAVSHPAQLNLGDALSHACAEACHVPLLSKGADFQRPIWRNDGHEKPPPKKPRVPCSGPWPW